VAHLKQTDADDWYTLGQEFQEMNNIEQALFCYDRGNWEQYFFTYFFAAFVFFLFKLSFIRVNSFAVVLQSFVLFRIVIQDLLVVWHVHCTFDK